MLKPSRKRKAKAVLIASATSSGVKYHSRSDINQIRGTLNAMNASVKRI
jgi:hypothetical protein